MIIKQQQKNTKKNVGVGLVQSGEEPNKTKDWLPLSKKVLCQQSGFGLKL